MYQRCIVAIVDEISCISFHQLQVFIIRLNSISLNLWRGALTEEVCFSINSRLITKLPVCPEYDEVIEEESIEGAEVV